MKNCTKCLLLINKAKTKKLKPPKKIEIKTKQKAIMKFDGNS